MAESHCYPYPHPAVTTDVTLFAIRSGRLHLALIERANPPYAGTWALPGGFLEMDEDLEDCARRELLEETGLGGDIYMEQLYTVGTPNRDPRERVISVVYLGLLADPDAEPRANSDARQAAWFPIDKLPSLAFDHPEIIRLAHQRLAAKLRYSTLGLRLLPKRFTLTEVQKVYEIVTGAPVDKRNFRKSLLATGEIEDSGELRRAGRQRPAKVYCPTHPGEVRYMR